MGGGTMATGPGTTTTQATNTPLQVSPILIMEKPVSSILRKEVLRPILEYPHLSLQISRWKILTTEKPKSNTSAKDQLNPVSPESWDPSKWKILTTAKPKSNT